jgi:phage terminase small subunit
MSEQRKLTIKQRAFVDEIIKGKVGSYQDAYIKVYDVALTKTGKVPKWVRNEASKLVANPNITMAIQRGLEKKEQTVVASAVKTKQYVIDRLYKESVESDSDASRVRALELLGKSVSLFTDVVENKEARSSTEIEAELEEKIEQLLTRH